MKCIPVISAIAILSLVSCDSMTGPITSGAYNPLLPAGSYNSTNPPATAATTFSAGQFVQASMDNAAFFKIRPNGNADADKLLKRRTSMKVISNSGGYVKVELDSGEVGFIPTVMVEDPKAAPQVVTTAPGEYQVYPPLPSTSVGQALPPIDPAGLPPEGSIPTVIDPDAPNANAPVPAVSPATGSFPTPPVEPKVETADQTPEAGPKIKPE